MRLGTLHEVETGLIERINATCVGVTRILDFWWFASIFVQYADVDEIKGVELQGLDTEAKIFGVESPMGLIRQMEGEHGELPAGTVRALAVEECQAVLSYNGHPVKRVLITAEKPRRIWEPLTHFYAYEEVHPALGQRGIAIISTFRVDGSKSGTLTLVISPDAEKTTGNYARIALQFEFVEGVKIPS